MVVIHKGSSAASNSSCITGTFPVAAVVVVVIVKGIVVSKLSKAPQPAGQILVSLLLQSTN